MTIQIHITIINHNNNGINNYVYRVNKLPIELNKFHKLDYNEKWKQ